jgi:hypothetical protein
VQAFVRRGQAFCRAVLLHECCGHSEQDRSRRTASAVVQERGRQRQDRTWKLESAGLGMGAQDKGQPYVHI